jgi:hypothetical protein
MFQRIEIPSVDTVRMAEGLNASYFALLFDPMQGGKEPHDD